MDGFYEYIAQDVSQEEFLNYNGYASQLSEQYKKLKELLKYSDNAIWDIVKEIKKLHDESYRNFKGGYKSDDGETYKAIEGLYDIVLEDIVELNKEIENMADECKKRRKVYSRMHENCTNLIKEIGLEDAYKYKFTIFGVAATAKKK